jgi:tripartite-type tricarboxylate transporter receptor subunit TctC
VVTVRITAEAGGTGWLQFAPAGTPPEVVQKLNAAMNRVRQMRDVRERLEALTFEPIGGSPHQFADYVRSEVAKWAVVVKQAGAKLE